MEAAAVEYGENKNFQEIWAKQEAWSIDIHKW